MKTQHTPGPWFAVNDGTSIHDRLTRFDEYGARIGETPNAIADIYTMPRLGEREANARLIAAAPELVAALKSLSEAVRDAGKEGTAGNLAHAEVQARATLAKAEGTT